MENAIALLEVQAMVTAIVGLVAMVKAAGGFVVLAHPNDEQMDRIDEYIAIGVEGIEVWHSDLSDAQRERAFKIAMEKDLYISGGSDHSGLCGGMYDTYEDPTVSEHYIEPMSCGVPYEYFMELKNGKVNR